METLFARQAPKRCRLCVMLGASLLLHSGVVGIAEMWTPPQPEKGTVDIQWDVVGSSDNPTPLPIQVESVEPSTPALLTAGDPVPTPPSESEDPALYEPVPTPPPRRPMVSKPLSMVRTIRSPVASTGPASTANRAVSSVGGLPGTGPTANAASWVMPHPSYPQFMMMKRGFSATTTVHIVTDAGGQVSNVVIVKSTGNPPLDNYTESYIRSHWHGPANASRNTEFVYQIK